MGARVLYIICILLIMCIFSIGCVDVIKCNVSGEVEAIKVLDNQIVVYFDGGLSESFFLDDSSSKIEIEKIYSIKYHKRCGPCIGTIDSIEELRGAN